MTVAVTVAMATTVARAAAMIVAQVAEVEVVVVLKACGGNI